MCKSLILILFFFHYFVSGQTTVNGSGSTFSSALVQDWASNFQTVSPSSVTITYNPNGSGTGVTDLISGVSDFAVSESPLSDSERAQISSSVLHIPSALGAISLAYNFPSNEITGQLNLTASIIAKIYTNVITSWNHTEIRAINPNLRSTASIVVVARNDSSGTTFAFTGYLSVTAPSVWTTGASKLPAWSSSFVTAIGNSGMASTINSNVYAIGYVQYGSTQNLPTARVMNANGRYVSISSSSIQASVTGITLPAATQSWVNVSLVNRPGDTVYPICTFTYFILRQTQTSRGAAGTALLAFLKYALYVSSQSRCSLFNLLALPENLRRQVFQSPNSMTVTGNSNDYTATRTYNVGYSLTYGSGSTYFPFTSEIISAVKVACERYPSTNKIALNCTSYSAGQSVVAVIGDILSGASMTLANSLGNAKIPQISPTSLSRDLSSKTNYPYFLRTVSPDNFQAAAIVSLLSSYQFRDIGLLVATGSYANPIQSELTPLLNQNNISVWTTQYFVAGTTNSSQLQSQMQAILNSGVTVIVVLATADDSMIAMRAARDFGLTKAGYAWITIMGGTVTGNDFEALQGALVLQPPYGRGVTYQQLIAYWLGKDPVNYPGSIWNSNTNPTPTLFVPSAFDSVYAIANAIDRLVALGIDQFDGPTLLSTISNSTFVGSMGTVGFDSNGNLFPASFEVTNVIGSNFQSVGRYQSGSRYASNTTVLWPGSQTTTPSGQRNLIYYIGGVFPTDPSLIDLNPILRDLSIEMLSAYRIACESINKHPTLAKRFQLKCIWQPTSFDRNSTVVAAQALTNSSIVGFVGTVYADNSEALASKVAGPMKIPQISPSANALVLSNKTAYPYFLRLSPSELSQVQSIVELISYYKWKQIATIGIGSSFFQNTVHMLIQECQKRGISVTNSQFLANTQDIPKLQQSLRAINDSGARIVFVNAFIQDVLVVFQEAANFNMTTKGWGWIGSPQTTLITREAFAPNPEAKEAMKGMVSIRPRGGRGAIYDYLISEWKFRDPIQYPGLLQYGYDEPITWSAETFDCVFAFAYAIDAVLANGGDPKDGAQLIRYLFSTNFTGATGRVGFNSQGDPYFSAFDLINFRDGKFVDVGLIDLSVLDLGNNTNSTVVQRTGTIVWPGGQLDTPYDHYVPPPPPEVIVQEGEVPAPAIVIVVVSLLIAFVAVWGVVYIYLREKRTGKSFFVQLEDRNLQNTM